MTSNPPAILDAARSDTAFDPLAAFMSAARLSGQSTLRLARRMYRSRFNGQDVPMEEFFRYGMHHPALSDSECRAFLGKKAVSRLNRLLNGPREGNDTLVLNDKLRTAAVLAAAGLPVARTRAVFASDPAFPGQPSLATVDELVRFLLDPANSPCFGKPIYGAFSDGVIAIEGPEPSGQLRLTDGRLVEARHLAVEIASRYGAGYLFQDLLRASEGVSAISGPVMPTLRVYLLRLSDECRPVYAALRLPAPGAMSDDNKHHGSVRLMVDLQTGRTGQPQDMHSLSAGAAKRQVREGVVGFQLPDWDRILQIAAEIHAQFPRQTSLGVDIALSDQGLIVNEANASPQHFTYQIVSRQGILNPDFLPMFRQALAERGVANPQGDLLDKLR